MILHVTLNQVGKLADLVLWNPALFGSKPEIVVKGGQIAWSQMGKIFCIFPREARFINLSRGVRARIA